MPLQAKVLSGGRSLKSLVSPVISVTIHSDIQRALGFPKLMLSTLATRDQIHNILCPTIGVTFKLDTSTTGRCGCLRSKDLCEQLKQRGYQKQVIDQAIEKVRHMERQNLLSYKPKPTANKVVLPFVLTYHPDLPKARGIVDKHWSIIDSSDHLSTVFP